MKKLPIWTRPATLPAFHDGESASVIEQTYKLYNAMQELITEYNAFAEEVNQKISDHEAKYNADMEIFTTSLRQEFQDFIDVVELKIADLEQEYKDMVTEYENNIKTYINQFTSNIEASFEQAIQQAVLDSWEGEF